MSPGGTVDNDDNILGLSAMRKLTISGNNSGGTVGVHTLESIQGGGTLSILDVDLDPASELTVGSVTVEGLIVTSSGAGLHIGGGMIEEVVAAGMGTTLALSGNITVGSLTLGTDSIMLSGAGSTLTLDNSWTRMGGIGVPGNGYVDGFTLGSGATLALGAADVSTYLLAVNSWTGGGSLEILIHEGAVTSSALHITDVLWGIPTSISGDPTTVSIAGNSDTALNMVGAMLKSGALNVWEVVVADGEYDGTQFVLESWETSRYRFVGTDGYDDTLDRTWWGYGLGGTVDYTSPWDPGRMVLFFELPKAQYADGPWMRFKGGKLNDSALAFSRNTYQTIQVGWDRVSKADDGGLWNVGLFVEGDWLYGKGEYKPRNDGKVWGALSATTTGTGFGYYLSRKFRNNAYFDFVGRTTWFKDKAHNAAFDGVENSYSADWKNRMFTLGLEVGRTFDSRDGRWSFNPYNRLLYHSTSGSQFDVRYGDGTLADVNLYGYGAWTNRLGGQLTLNNVRGSSGNGCNPCDMVASDPCVPCGTKDGRITSRYFVGADWYKGLSGRFGGSHIDPLAGASTLGVARARNNVSYGVASVGMTLLPSDNLEISLVGESLFGNVNGYGMTLVTKVSF